MPRGVYKRTKLSWNKGLTKETDERIARNGAAHLGMKYKPMSDEGKANIAASHIGVPKSVEHIANIVAANTGQTRSVEAVANISAGVKKYYEDPKAREKQSGTMKEVMNRPEVKAANSFSKMGDKHWNWQGGITSLHRRLYHNLEYKQWRKVVFTRDNHICQKCGQVGGNLEAHHIKPFSVILFENNITIYEEGINCAELWDINNGTTLCEKCHEKEQKLTLKLVKESKDLQEEEEK